MRATFEVPRSLVEQFRLLAKRNERTFSAELRQLMRDAVDRNAAAENGSGRDGASA